MSQELDERQLRNLHNKISYHLEEISKLFIDETAVTVVIEPPGGIDRVVILTSGDLHKAADSLKFYADKNKDET